MELISERAPSTTVDPAEATIRTGAVCTRQTVSSTRPPVRHAARHHSGCWARYPAAQSPAPAAIRPRPTGGTTDVSAPSASSEPPAVSMPALLAALPTAISPYPIWSRRRPAVHAFLAQTIVEITPPTRLNRAAH